MTSETTPLNGVHEAGHTVAIWAAGLPVAGIRHGWTEEHGELGSFDLMVTALAGAAAEQIIAGNEDGHPSDPDWAKLSPALRKVAREEGEHRAGEQLGRAKDRADELVSAQRRAIEALAPVIEALPSDEVLSHDEAVKIARDHWVGSRPSGWN